MNDIVCVCQLDPCETSAVRDHARLAPALPLQGSNSGGRAEGAEGRLAVPRVRRAPPARLRVEKPYRNQSIFRVPSLRPRPIHVTANTAGTEAFTRRREHVVTSLEKIKL